MARRSSEVAGEPPIRRALFTDRDGTLNPDLHYLKDAERLELFRGVGSALSLAHAHGYIVLCVTNQSGIERGFYTDEDVVRIHRRVNERLRAFGTQVDGFYYCPHAPEHGCACRKPGTLLFEEARRDWNVDFASSAVVGDSPLDIAAGRRLGLLTAYVPSPAPPGSAARGFAAGDPRPDLEAGTFESAVLRILARG
ncbi:MAG: D-glycero-alpha-D-manno-heptose-1,7-bisphosphate 7-phosphatase [Thermoplasmata archaeon]